MKKVLFITGGTGMIGRQTIKEFIDNTDYDICLLIHQKGKNKTKSYITKDLLNIRPTAFKRIHIVKGNITKSGLELSFESKKFIIDNTTQILHCAASTRFDMPLENAREINVKGTENLLILAQDCKRLENLGFISTVYVSGARSGIIYENENIKPQKFINTYEQTKYEAEQLIRNNWKTIPSAIYRISTVIGDSTTGYVSHFTAPHHALRMMYLGLAAMVPGKTTYKVDLIPSDFAAKILFTLFFYHFSNKQVFHIASIPKKSYELQKTINENYNLLAKYDILWKAKNYPKPVLATEETFRLFISSALEVENPILFGVLKSLSTFAYQLNYPKVFDHTNTLSKIPNYDELLPDISNYYEKVVQYCLKTKWGKI